MFFFSRKSRKKRKIPKKVSLKLKYTLIPVGLSNLYLEFIAKGNLLGGGLNFFLKIDIENVKIEIFKIDSKGILKLEKYISEK